MSAEFDPYIARKTTMILSSNVVKNLNKKEEIL